MDELQRITWFAGLFEGEGSFCFHQGKPKALSIMMTDEDVLLRVQEYFGGSIHKVKKRQEHWKDCWKWSMSGEKSVELTKKILPFLGERRSARGQEYADNYRTLAQRKQRAVDLQHRVESLRAEGLTHREIASIVGKDRTYVTHLLNR